MNFIEQPSYTAQLGAKITASGVNFCLHCSSATISVALHLFSQKQDSIPSRSIVLDPIDNRCGNRWQIHVDGCQAGQLYLYTVDGPYQPERGLRFNPDNFLQDPYAKAVCQTLGPEKKENHKNIDTLAKCIVYDDDFDWQGDRPLHYPLSECIIYEAHIKGMTQNCPYQNPGSYLGVIEHIPYLKNLGITSIEFLPLMNFSPYDYSERYNPDTGKPLSNYWGYNTRNFFVPALHYATKASSAITEFKQMVQALHSAGIEIILDVVFNHSAEADEQGPTLSFRGIDNPAYYILQGDRRFYANDTGCGNVFNCNHPLVREFIIDCLRYWVLEMHVDGFRFDLASIFRRNQRGEIIAADLSLVEALSQDSVLAHTKLIAEPWDAGGAYLLGDFGQSFVGQSRWAEWNDRYRDDIRQFWSASLNASKLAMRITGSSDIFHRPEQRPFHSINFLNCHDGYTLRDLFSYNEKHNLMNGEQNRDGHNHSFNRNYGCEGPSDPSVNEDIGRRRCRMVKNHLVTLLLSAGTPMLSAGDELGNTQKGNNNPYCQDNQLSWLQYVEDNDPEFSAYESLYRFTAQLIALRRELSILRRREFFRENEIRWYGLTQDQQLYELHNSEQWNQQNHSLGLLIDGSLFPKPNLSLFCMFNASQQLLHFPLPGKLYTESNYSSNHWQAIIDTNLPAPLDINLPFGPYVCHDNHKTNQILGYSHSVAAQSVVVLMG